MKLGALSSTDTFIYQKTKITQSSSITSMATDGKKIYVGSLNGVIRGWNLTSDKHEGAFSDHRDVINGMVILNNSTMISVSDDSSIIHWSTKSYDKIRKFQGPEKSVTCCAVMYDKQLAARLKNPKGECVVFGGTWEGRVYVWDLTLVNPSRVLLGHPAPIKKIVPYQVKGINCLATGCNNGELWVWELQKFTPVFKVQAHVEMICHLKVHDGLLVSSGKDNSNLSRSNKIKFWDEDFNLVQEVEAGREHVNKFEMLDNRFFVAVSGIKSLEIWDRKKNRRVVDKGEGIGIVTEMALVDSSTMVIAKSKEVNIMRYVNKKLHLLKFLHQWRMEMGHLPIVVKMVYETLTKGV